MFVNTSNHSDSYLTGSTIEKMVQKNIDLGSKFFALTDNGVFSGIAKAYDVCKNKGINFIPGIEVFFRDGACPIIDNTPSTQIKYFKLILHCRDQHSFQELVKIYSSILSRVSVMGNSFPLLNWSDLEAISKLNITAMSSNVEDMVCKHLLVSSPSVSIKYFEKLKELFKDRYYLSIIPQVQDQHWESVTKLILGKEGEEIQVSIPSKDRVETDAYDRAKAGDITRGRRHKSLDYIYINNIRYSVKKECRNILGSLSKNEFKPLPKDIQFQANKLMLALAAKYDMLDKLVFNSYAYYAEDGDKIVQNVKLGEDKRVFQHQHIRSYEEIKQYCLDTALMDEGTIENIQSNTTQWAEQFKGIELKYDYRLPELIGDPVELLRERIEQVGRMKWNDSRYTTQLEDELKVLTENGVINLIPYFMPLIGVFKYYEDNGYLTGPGRGSAAGFLISYLAGITHVDPIVHGLHSSRFLTLDRVKSGSFPDIDVDLEDRAPLVGNDGNGGYLYRTYGKKAAQVSTRTLLRIKSAILDADRFVHGSVRDHIAEMVKKLPITPQGVEDKDFVFGYNTDEGGHHNGLIDTDSNLQEYVANNPEEWEIVKKALSMSRQFGRHAAAYLISNRDIEEDIPIMSVGGVDRVTAYEHKYCEKFGMIKYDFLVISILKDIRYCLDYLNKKNGKKTRTGYIEHEGKEHYIWELPYDENVFKMMHEGKTETVFQLNTTSVTPFVVNAKPNSILDIATITSLVRPGPLDFVDENTGRNMAEEYIERKFGRSKGEIEELNQMIPETYGVLVFQEQITKVAKELGNMSPVDAENVRIAMGKKKMKEMEKLKPIFIEGASKNTSPETAEKIWEMMATFGRYGFNLSHAFSYSVVAYACAFLKYHYHLEWWASVLSNADSKEINEVFYKYVKDLVLPPDINTSTEVISIDYNLGKLRNKLSMIKGLGVKAAGKIIDNRPYSSVKDFVCKKVCGPSLTRKLIHVGVLDSLFEPKDTLLAKLQKYENVVKEIDWESKLEKYREKIDNETDEKKLKSAERSYQKILGEGPRRGEVPAEYYAIDPKRDFLMKKAVFPTMNLNLFKIMEKYSVTPVLMGGNFPRILMSNREYPFLDSEHVQRIEQMEYVEKPVYFGTAGYIVDCEEFSYQKGSKRAFKIILDISGYINEYVIWPDRDTGELEYPNNIKKGAIVNIVLRRSYSEKRDCCFTNISEINVECESIS